MNCFYFFFAFIRAPTSTSINILLFNCNHWFNSIWCLFSFPASLSRMNGNWYESSRYVQVIAKCISMQMLLNNLTASLMCEWKCLSVHGIDGEKLRRVNILLSLFVSTALARRTTVVHSSLMIFAQQAHEFIRLALIDIDETKRMNNEHRATGTFTQCVHCTQL